MKLLWTLGTVAGVAFYCGILAAQTNRGGITGTVFDSAGAVVPGATVVVKNVGRNATIKVKTSSDGVYTVQPLDPVVYNVTVEVSGFKTTTIENIKVDTASIATVNFKLEPGTVNTQVTVTAETTQVNTESGTTGSVITAREMTDFPLVNRSVLNLAVILPNVAGDPGSEDPGLSANDTVPGYNLSVNGGRPGSTLFLADGVNNTGVSLARTMVSFSPETVQEFTVQTSVFSAEYGSVGGGIINTTTKSGTNDFHGTALWYNRNPYLAAGPWSSATNNKPKANLKYNQFSVTAGGPVYIPRVYKGKDKTFWFAALEPRYRRDYLPQYGMVPTEAMKHGDFSNTVFVQSPGGAVSRVPLSVAQQFGLTPRADDVNIYNHYILAGNQFSPAPTPAAGGTYAQFPGNVIPQNIFDPVALNVLPYIHGPGTYFYDPNRNLANFYNPRSLRQDETRYTISIDHILSAKEKINGRYTYQPTIKDQFTPDSPLTDKATYSWSRQAMIAYTRQFSATFMNDLRLNYTRGRFSTTLPPEFDLKTGRNLNAEWGLPSFLPGGMPALPFTGGLQGSQDVEDIEERYSITDTAYVTRGSMSWKFGVDLSYALQNVTPLRGSSGGIYDIRALQTNSNGANNGTGGDFFASFLLGVINGATFRPAIIRYYYRWKGMAGFVQNDWKVRPNLTLNLGVRYSLDLPRTEKYDHQGVFRPDLAKGFPVPGGSVPIPNSGGISIPLASIQVPAYAFVGKGGRSRYLYPAKYLNFEPRFGFAWSPRFIESHHVILRGGYGISHLPLTGIARLPDPDFGGTQGYSGGPADSVDRTHVVRLGINNPAVPAFNPDQAIFANIPQDGILYINPGTISSLSMPGYAVSENMTTPYSQSWNLTAAWQATPRTSLEVSYVGNKGTHLFLGGENINPRSTNFLNQLDANAVNPDSTATGANGNGVPDPLGRVNPANGRLIVIQPGTLQSAYAGFAGLWRVYNSSGNSIRHAASVSLLHRQGRGLLLRSNYTYGKSIDDSQGPNAKFVLTSGQNPGQVVLGAPLAGDRSVSTYDQKHIFNTSALYDLPFGRGATFLNGTNRALDSLVGGWTLAGIYHMASGFPAWVTMVDSNQMGDPSQTHTIRPDLVPGVPLVNPLWSRDCPIGCQPYVNPAAFKRPPVGQYGNAPRSLDGVRGPLMQYFDVSIEKNFKLGEGKRRIQLRMDLLNVLNHPMFRVGNNSQPFNDFMSAPNTGMLSGAEYNNWATANGRPMVTVDKTGNVTGGPGRPIYNGINTMVSTYRNSKGVLPNDFFSITLPANFATQPATSYDITQLQDYKLFRLRQAFNTGFGGLYSPSENSRYIQLGLKIFF